MNEIISRNTLLHDRYLIKDSLGQGGMGAVYLAEDQRLKCEVAIKQCLLEIDENTQDAFNHEAILLANLNHPGLPKVFDYFTNDSGQFLVMELIRGVDLEGLRKERGGKFLVLEIQEITNQLLQILNYLHNQKIPIIHKDIKPANLKLSEHNQLKLLDFGLAKGSAGIMPESAKSILSGHTPAFASPEQLEGATTDCRSDIFSVGATLFHLLTGDLPPHALNVRALSVARGLEDPLPLVSDLNAEIPYKLAEIISKAMALNAGSRFSTVFEMNNSLNDIWKYYFEDETKRKESASKYFELGLGCSDEDFDCMIRHYTKAIDLNPLLAGAYNNRGIAYDRKGYYNQAVNDYLKAIALNPNFVEAILNLGLACHNQKRFDDAIEYYCKVIELKPDFVIAYNNRALTYVQKGDLRRKTEGYFVDDDSYEKAILDWNKYIELNPDDAFAYNKRGDVYYHKKFNWEQGWSDYYKAIQLNANFTDAYFNLGSLCLYICQYDLSIEHCSKAIELKEDFAEAYNCRGAAYHAKREYEKAINDFSKAIELNPNFVDAYRGRSNSYEVIGSIEKARQDVDKYRMLESKK